MPIDYSKFDAIEDSDDEKEKQEASKASAKAEAKKEPTTCPNCAKDLSGLKSFRCGKCKKVSYCSQKCQREDWQFHKRNCVKEEPEKPKAPAAPKSAPSETSRRKEEKVVVDDDDDVGTWYRHREWRPEQKQEFKPTQIDASSAAAAAASAPAQRASEASVGSEWNKAGTWEDCDKTEWAKARLPELLVGLKADLPGGRGSLEVQKVDTFGGDASISVVRGTARYLFDLTFVVHVAARWMGSDGAKEAKAKLNILEFTDSLASQYSESEGFPCEVSADPAGSVISLKEALQDLGPAGLRREVFRSMLDWVKEFQAQKR